MFGIGTTELLIILVIILLLFGSSKLPQLGRGLGEGLRSFRDAMKGHDAAQSSTASSAAVPPADNKTAGSAKS